ncbi:outer membrane lipoprotein carrier protein LolA [Planktomarina temperata]|jgi:outer membrane lipoprotein-sorting protein|uniref:outer-membrane lipoprotein carrier protein LolA n=1 Tax=Planktomarina TaxID=1284657 RepID=UPI000E8B52AB|nr:outer membrane lipoprotein carrier protein LolA [Planktomarina temperata]MDA9082754.1 outer membrane lipoprotein carrier protein LolA [bacterium]MCO4817789.1 outer membrane lipoprotein carrier protein LolA [Planktomarina temperata]MDA7482124.1 outer membrane lipoprotein carrier protein LolA [Planktomarina temperata]MDA9046668.1 outer membrane lipoprotein carrier protein LolA [Planktomarina temperata]
MRLISALCVILANPVAAEKISLNEISSYFNDMVTAEAQFSQFSDTGETTTGRLYIRRPGRIRFEYDPPDATLVVVGGGQVAVFDPKSRDEPLRFPLRHSPLNLVLEREVDLAQRDMVVAHFEAGSETAVTLQDPENPDYGFIQLIFTDNPVQLRQWVVQDNSGGRTQIVLDSLTEGGRVSNVLFNIQYEMQKRSE